MSDADRAYAAAEAAIEKAKAEGATQLSFNNEQFRPLDRIPPQINELSDLLTVDLSNTKITDLAPLAAMTGLMELGLYKTNITDLAPLMEMKRLRLLVIGYTNLSDFSPLERMIGLATLYLSNTRITDLAPLAPLTELRNIDVSYTQITDLSPLAGSKGFHDLTLSNTEINDLAPLIGKSFRELDLGNTQVLDLRPTLGMTLIESTPDVNPPNVGLSFKNTPAIERDKRLAELAQIEDDEERTRETLAYLRTLPQWPEPYIPAATPDGSPPQPIGAVPPNVQTGKAQIQSLVRNGLITRISAQNFAAQIEDALRGVPATDGNNLAEPLQTMLEFAEVLRNLAPETTPVTDPLNRAHLELRIAQLEALVSRLSGQLSDETKRREAVEALAKKDGFIATHNKSFATEAGKWNARLVYVGVPSAAVYFLGAENALVATLSKVFAGMLK